MKSPEKQFAEKKLLFFDAPTPSQESSETPSENQKEIETAQLLEELNRLTHEIDELQKDNAELKNLLNELVENTKEEAEQSEDTGTITEIVSSVGDVVRRSVRFQVNLGRRMGESTGRLIRESAQRDPRVRLSRMLVERIKTAATRNTREIEDLRKQIADLEQAVSDIEEAALYCDNIDEEYFKEHPELVTTLEDEDNPKIFCKKTKDAFRDYENKKAEGILESI